MLKSPKNSLLDERPVESLAVKTEGLKAKTIFNLPTVSKKREYLKLFRKQTAAEAIKNFSKEVDTFGFTKGQFSLIELLEATLDKTGPGHLTLSTWTAAKADLNNVLDFLNSGKIKSARFLLDFSFQRRQPEVAKRIRDIFGLDSLRITRNHAKFFLIAAPEEGWTVSCKTSMNLNKNPRFEDFDLSNSTKLFSFLDEIVSELFGRTNIRNQESSSIKELCREFTDH